jgi:hypothetical protein
MRRMPMIAPGGRSNSALVKRRSDAVQARYPSRPQLCDNRRQFVRDSVGASCRRSGCMRQKGTALTHEST